MDSKDMIINKGFLSTLDDELKRKVVQRKPFWWAEADRRDRSIYESFVKNRESWVRV